MFAGHFPDFIHEKIFWKVSTTVKVMPMPGATRAMRMKQPRLWGALRANEDISQHDTPFCPQTVVCTCIS